MPKSRKANRHCGKRKPDSKRTTALLKAAVTGELTRDWREMNKPTETGHDLLARIRAERAANVPANGRRAYGPAPAPPDASDLPKLPKSWAWGTLDALKAGDQRNGISIVGSPNPPGVKALRLDALTPSGIDVSVARYIPLADERIADYRIRGGDLLVSRANGSAELVGRAVYVAEIDETVVFPDTMIRYPLGGDLQLGQWIGLAWTSPLTRVQIRRLAKTTAGILKISQQDISRIALPVPPFPETAEILRRVSDALTATSEARALLDTEAADAARLRQSILKAAFEGRLVPQDPDDEPASALLARMKPPANEGSRRAGRRRAVPASAR
ncbi:MAG: hypothetical protein ACREFJ_01545 [Acetobacteraceae bacterium]